MRHFPGSNSTGSVFYAKTPAEFLTSAVAQFPEVFRNAQPDPKDGRKRLSFTAEENIGLCNVVNINALTPEESDTITEQDRDGSMVKVAISNRTFPTREFQIILDEMNTVITMFPGPLAPNLPKKGEHSEFWDNHVFIHNP